MSVGTAGARDGVRWQRLARELALAVEVGGERRFRFNRTKASPAAAILVFLRRPGPDPVADEAMLLAEHLGRIAG